MQNLQKRQNSEGKSILYWKYIFICLTLSQEVFFYFFIESMAGYFYYEHEGFSKNVSIGICFSCRDVMMPLELVKNW